MTTRVSPEITGRARQLRSEAKRAERRLWSLISGYRPKFTRQLPVGSYFADFACRKGKLIVELDGGQHADCDRDQSRDAYLRSEGWRVLRFWTDEVLRNPEGVVMRIMDEAADCLGGTHPQPLS